MNKGQKQEIKQRIASEIEKTQLSVDEYKEQTKPIAPENAIGRVSRMDAINNKSVNEAALRQVEKQRKGLERALERLDSDRFGLCTLCGEAIPTGRILLVPGAVTCVRCAR